MAGETNTSPLINPFMNAKMFVGAIILLISI
jgi:hypothetical protein